MAIRPSTDQRELFAGRPELPDGMAYRTDILPLDDEVALQRWIAALPLDEARYKEFTARRRVLSFGFGYDFARNALVDAPPLPERLQPLRALVAAWAAIPANDLVQATVAEYRPGTQLGWHRDVPHFGQIVGVSLGTACRMRLRPYPHRAGTGRTSLALDLAPRSAYVMRAQARWGWQHAISPTKSLRYSVTFRTLVPRDARALIGGGSRSRPC